MFEPGRIEVITAGNAIFNIRTLSSETKKDGELWGDLRDNKYK